MKTPARFLGHPIHPMLIVFPLGLLITAVAFDIVYLITADHSWLGISFWLITAGIVGGLLAASAGAVDWWKLPRGSRAHRVGLIHAGNNLAAILVFIVSWCMRLHHPTDLHAAPIALGFIGLVLLCVGGWLGGELVDRLGVGVDDGANVNASNSLTGHSARPAPPA